MPLALLRVVVTLTCLLVMILPGVVVSRSLGPDALKRRPLRAEEAAPFTFVQGDLLEFESELPIVEDPAIAEFQPTLVDEFAAVVEVEFVAHDDLEEFHSTESIPHA